MGNEMPKLSVALGFWVRYQEAMDAVVYEESADDPTPPELKKVVEEYEGSLDRIQTLGERDGNELIRTISTQVATEWGSNDALFIEQKKSPKDWAQKLYVHRKTEPGRAPIEVGFQIKSTPRHSLSFYCYLWQKGGKRGAEDIARRVSGENSSAFVRVGRSHEVSAWHPGTVLIAAIPLTELLVGDDLDCEGLVTRATSMVLQCRTSALVKCLEPPSGSG